MTVRIDSSRSGGPSRSNPARRCATFCSATASSSRAAGAGAAAAAACGCSRARSEPSAEEAGILSQAELASGWRLACRMTRRLRPDARNRAVGNVDPGRRCEVRLHPARRSRRRRGPRHHHAGGAVGGPSDGERAGGAHGAQPASGARRPDVMSRVEFALTAEGRAELRDLIRAQIGGMIAGMLAEAAPGRAPSLITVVGNTVMHHLFCGRRCHPACLRAVRAARRRREALPARRPGLGSARRYRGALPALPGRLRRQRHSGRHYGHQAGRKRRADRPDRPRHQRRDRVRHARANRVRIHRRRPGLRRRAHLVRHAGGDGRDLRSVARRRRTCLQRDRAGPGARHLRQRAGGRGRLRTGTRPHSAGREALRRPA